MVAHLVMEEHVARRALCAPMSKPCNIVVEAARPISPNHCEPRG